MVLLNDLLVPVSAAAAVPQVIQRFCLGCSYSTCQQEELKDLQLSLPISTETVGEDLDSAMQVCTGFEGRAFT